MRAVVAMSLIGCIGASTHTLEVKSVLAAKVTLIAARDGDEARVHSGLAELLSAPPSDAVSIRALVELWERFEDYRGESGPVLVAIGPPIYPFVEHIAREPRRGPAGSLVARMGPTAMPKLLQWVNDEHTAAAGLAGLQWPKLKDEVVRRAPEVLATITPLFNSRSHRRDAFRVVELIGGEHAAPIAAELIRWGNHRPAPYGMCGNPPGLPYRRFIDPLLRDMGTAALPHLLDALGGDRVGPQSFARSHLRQTRDPLRIHFLAEILRVIGDPRQSERHEAAREAAELLSS